MNKTWRINFAFRFFPAGTVIWRQTANRDVKGKIRQQLQVLRDAGLLLHVERGIWRLPWGRERSAVVHMFSFQFQVARLANKAMTSHTQATGLAKMRINGHKLLPCDRAIMVTT